MPQHSAECGSVDCIVNLPACHRSWPQALAEALKVNKTLTNMNLGHNKISKEGVEAWGLARRASGLRQSDTDGGRDFGVTRGLGLVDLPRGLSKHSTCQ